MNSKHTIWAEKYRPTNLDSYICDDKIREKVQEFLTNQDIPHLGFFGLQGSGKSTLAKILVNNIDCDFIYTYILIGILFLSFIADETRNC